MPYNSIATVVLLVLGLLLLFFARPIADMKAKFGLLGIISSRLGIDVRVRIIRITGVILLLLPIILLLKLLVA